MQDKIPVSLRISSRSRGQKIEQVMDGELFRKALSVFVRYQEPSETDEGITTLLKFTSDGSVKIRRTGTVDSEMTFIEGLKTEGRIGVNQGNIPLSVYTRRISNRLEEGLGTVALSYDLEASASPLGRFEIEFRIEAKMTGSS